MKPEEKRIRGRTILAYANYIRNKKGRLGLEAAEKDMGMKFSGILKDRWYPNSVSDNLVSWISKTYGLQEVRKAGNYMVSEMGIIMASAREMGMEKVLESMNEARENSNFGSLDVRREEWGMTVTVREFCTDPDNSEAWHGILEGCMKLTGTPGTVEKGALSKKGGGACTYRIKLSQ